MQGGYWIADLGSRNGTQLNGERFRGEARWLANGDTIVDRRRGAALPRPGRRRGSRRRAPRSLRRPSSSSFAGERLTLGRDPSNDVVLDDPNVSRFHAEVVRARRPRSSCATSCSRNGTRVDGELARRALLEHRLRDRHRAVPPHLRRHRLRRARRARRAAPRRGGRRDRGQGQADPAADRRSASSRASSSRSSARAAPGKSTLMKALAGVTTPSGGHDHGQRRAGRRAASPTSATCPQDEIVHRQADASTRRWTTPRACGSRSDTSARRRSRPTVDRVLDELALEQHARHPHRARCRAGSASASGVAAELLEPPEPAVPRRADDRPRSRASRRG